MENENFEGVYCRCGETEEIVEIFIYEYSFFLCGSCKKEYLRSAANG